MCNALQNLGSPKTILTSDTNCKFSRPKITLKLDNSLEQFTEHKAIMFTVMVYHNESTQIQISQGQKHIEQSLGNPTCRATVVLFQ